MQTKNKQKIEIADADYFLKTPEQIDNIYVNEVREYFIYFNDIIFISNCIESASNRNKVINTLKNYFSDYLLDNSVLVMRKENIEKYSTEKGLTFDKIEEFGIDTSKISMDLINHYNPDGSLITNYKGFNIRLRNSFNPEGSLITNYKGYYIRYRANLIDKKMRITLCISGLDMNDYTFEFVNEEMFCEMITAYTYKAKEAIDVINNQHISILNETNKLKKINNWNGRKFETGDYVYFKGNDTYKECYAHVYKHPLLLESGKPFYIISHPDGRDKNDWIYLQLTSSQFFSLTLNDGLKYIGIGCSDIFKHETDELILIERSHKIRAPMHTEEDKIRVLTKHPEVMDLKCQEGSYQEERISLLKEMYKKGISTN
jgi:hypothetical protein